MKKNLKGWVKTITIYVFISFSVLIWWCINVKLVFLIVNYGGTYKHRGEVTSIYA